MKKDNHSRKERIYGVTEILFGLLVLVAVIFLFRDEFRSAALSKIRGGCTGLIAGNGSFSINSCEGMKIGVELVDYEPIEGNGE